MAQYIALIHKDADSDYGVSFPDLPGCVSAGSTLDEARDMAAEALALHLEGMAEDGEPIPEPSTLEAIMNDPENRDGVAIIVRADIKAPKAVRVTITMPEDVLKDADRYADEHGYTRSGLLARAVRQEIRRHTHVFEDAPAKIRVRSSFKDALESRLTAQVAARQSGMQSKKVTIRDDDTGESEHWVYDGQDWKREDAPSAS